MMAIGTILFNPFTGKPRDPRDIASDPHGGLIWDGDTPLVAAKPADPLAIALNTMHPDCHRAADAFWGYWRENGETHRHGYYESTWGAINRALRTVGVVPWIPLSERPKTVGASTGAKSENQPDKS